MLSAEFKTYLEEGFDFIIKSTQGLSGGDINSVYHIKTNDDHFVIKVNDVDAFPGMFQKEANGLMVLRDTRSIDVPQVLGFGDFEDSTYLLLEYKESGIVDRQFWELFGHQLAALHRNSRESFGFDEDNYIGSLPQYNRNKKPASEFFIEQRLKPQFKMANERGFNFNNLDAFYKQVEQLIPDELPALIHGDLWSGNYLVNSENKPCLIDPAVAYAPREMDLAMMKLFGGFDERMFQAYQESFPLENDFEERIPLWQLYYILAHVNLFGGHYYSRAKEIMAYY
jgi:fructosamine-3-kinase